VRIAKIQRPTRFQEAKPSYPYDVRSFPMSRMPPIGITYRTIGIDRRLQISAHTTSKSSILKEDSKEEFKGRPSIKPIAL